MKGGVQQVRAVLALLQLDEHTSALQIAQVMPLTPQTIRSFGDRYQEAGLERASYEKRRPGAADVFDPNQKTAHYRGGVQRSAGRPGSLDRAAGGRRSRQTETGATRRKTIAVPLPQAVAGKNVVVRWDNPAWSRG
jgi:hypothetical protein